MPTTTRAGLPYPALSDPPNGPAQFQSLAQSLDTKVSPDAAWTQFTPDWHTSTATDPVLGNGSLKGWYQKIGRIVHVHMILSIGSTTTAGAGTFTFGNFPFTSASGREHRLQASAFAAGGIMWHGVAVFPGGSATVSVYLPTSQSDMRLALAQSANTANAAGTGVPNRPGNYSYVSGENLHVYGTYESNS